MKTKQYEVYVDDNYHFMDQDERYRDGCYDSLQEALERCKKITIKSLHQLYKTGTTPEKLSARWSMFGDDPFIPGTGGSIPFSARKFITTELCKTIIDSHSKVNRDQ